MNNILKELKRDLDNLTYDYTKPTCIVTLGTRNKSDFYKAYEEMRKKFDKTYNENKEMQVKLYCDVRDLSIDDIQSLVNKTYPSTVSIFAYGNFHAGVDFERYIKKVEFIEYVDDFDDFTFDDITELKED